jgi:hypothetical protein
MTKKPPSGKEVIKPEGGNVKKENSKTTVWPILSERSEQSANDSLLPESLHSNAARALPDPQITLFVQCVCTVLRSLYTAITTGSPVRYNRESMAMHRGLQGTLLWKRCRFLRKRPRSRRGRFTRFSCICLGSRAGFATDGYSTFRTSFMAFLRVSFGRAPAAICG